MECRREREREGEGEGEGGRERERERDGDSSLSFVSRSETMDSYLHGDFILLHMLMCPI